MNARILTFSSQGDTTILEYDPATADMDEVNRVIAEYEAKTGAQPFDVDRRTHRENHSGAKRSVDGSPHRGWLDFQSWRLRIGIGGALRLARS